MSNQFSNESVDDEINAELDSILATQLPEVPSQKLPEIETKQKDKKGILLFNLLIITIELL